MLQHSPILTPVIILILWTFVMLFWMALVRLPMIAKLKLKPEAGERTSKNPVEGRQLQSPARATNHFLRDSFITSLSGRR